VNLVVKILLRRFSIPCEWTDKTSNSLALVWGVAGCPTLVGVFCRQGGDDVVTNPSPPGPSALGQALLSSDRLDGSRSDSRQVSLDFFPLLLQLFNR